MKNLRYPLLQSFIMLGYLKKLFKKSIGLKERHPFGEEKSHSSSNGIKFPAKINQAKTQKISPEVVNSKQE